MVTHGGVEDKMTMWPWDMGLVWAWAALAWPHSSKSRTCRQRFHNES